MVFKSVNTYVLTDYWPVTKLLGMSGQTKTEQLQIRVSAAQKKRIQQAAKRAGMDMSAYALHRLLSVPAAKFQECLANCAEGDSPRYALAELNALLSGLSAAELRDAVAAGPPKTLSPFLANYIAAMVEHACARCSVAIPDWTRSVTPLETPVFATPLQSLRLHLLAHAPAAFRYRNIFVDSSVGDQI
jgi:hypothetical protein